jgi:hypothetical protein
MVMYLVSHSVHMMSFSRRTAVQRYKCNAVQLSSVFERTEQVGCYVSAMFVCPYRTSVYVANDEITEAVNFVMTSLNSR